MSGKHMKQYSANKQEANVKLSSIHLVHTEKHLIGKSSKI
jgi:hypothetical protein